MLDGRQQLFRLFSHQGRLAAVACMDCHIPACVWSVSYPVLRLCASALCIQPWLMLIWAGQGRAGLAMLLVTPCDLGSHGTHV